MGRIIDNKLLGAVALTATMAASCAWVFGDHDDRGQLAAEDRRERARQTQAQAGSEQVRQLQRRLNAMGYDAGHVDGILGPQTQAALRNFQQARGIEATGQMNDQTNRALEMASADRNHGQAASAQNLSAAQLRQVQIKLNDMGYHAGDVTGQWNSQTQAAVRDFQRAKNLQVTSEINQQTLDALSLNIGAEKQVR